MDNATAHLDVATVRALFGPPVTRVMLDWDRLAEIGATVSVEVLTGGGLDRLVTPWFVDTTIGCEVSYRDPAGQPLRTSEVPRHLAMLEPGRAARMAAIAASCTPGAETWVVPCYAIGTDLLLLDGNHRVSSHFVHDLNARILSLVIHGPLDPTILPDLGRFSPDAPSEGNLGRVRSGVA